MTDEVTTRHAVSALRAIHTRLAALAKPLDADTATAPSMASEWSLAQVYSHLGSGAEIGLAWFQAAVVGGAPMGQEEMRAIWAVRDTTPPAEQVRRAVAADDALVSAYEKLSGSELAAAGIALFGSMTFDGGGLAQLRLSEAAVHLWDIEAALQPGAGVLADAAALLVDRLPGNAWLGKPQPRPATLLVRTTEPARELVLASGPDGTHLTAAPAANGVDGTLDLPAEALIRLMYGRSVPGDAAQVRLATEALRIEDLHQAFPGI